ncbi:hypothetical protein Clacol_001945 [Clathrus columnatus]|uniref:Uncharacterized protein n=1 Tax=Clathrus columnatus TaxID=1419009 RepID=A0AAV5A0H0_9AGAM|nr:hypothetical protein Clacol_001945 [Clathrus columnatus]
MSMDTRPLPEGWEERFDETYWLWMRSDPPQKSYRHPLGEIAVSGRRASAANNPSLPLTQLPSNSTAIDHSETAHDAPAYYEFSERLEATEQHDYTGNQDYRADLSSPSSFSGFTDSSRSSELSAPPPSADDFYATSVRQRSFIASAAASVPPLSPQRSVSATSSRLGGTNISSPLVRGPRAPPGPKPRTSSLSASGPTTDIPTFSVKYRSGILDSSSNSNPSTHPPTSGIPGLYTQVQYHGPQSQIVNMQSLQSQPQPQPGPSPPIMWRQDLQGQSQNQIVVRQVQPQPQSQIPIQTQPLGANEVMHARFSSPPQPVALTTMPAPGQPGYAGFSHSRIPSARFFENQGPMLVPSSAQENFRPQLMAPPPPPPPPLNHQQGIQKGMPLRSSPPPGGIIPAPYNPSMPSLVNRSSQQRPGSGMPPYSSPPPGGFAPAPYSVTSKQPSGSTSSQQGSHQTYLPTAGPNISPQPNPPPGGFVPTASQAQAVPSGHSPLYQQPQQTPQQLSTQLQFSPQQQQLSSLPSREYVPVQYHLSQVQPPQQSSQVLEAVQQQPQQPTQQVVTPPQSSPRPEVYVPVSYTTSQTQVEPSRPLPGGYIPVSYDASQAQPGLSQQQQQLQVQQTGVQQNSQGQQQQVHVTPTNSQGIPTSSPSQNSTEVPLNGPQTISVPEQQSMDASASSRPNSAPGGYVPVSYYPAQTSAPPNAQPPSVTPPSSTNSSVNGPTVTQPTGIPPQSQLVQASAQTQTQTQVNQSVPGPTLYNVTATLTTQVQSNPSQSVAVDVQTQEPRVSYFGSPRGSTVLPPRRLQKPRPQTHAHATKHTMQYQPPPPPPHQHPPPPQGNYGPYLQPHPSGTIYTSPLPLGNTAYTQPPPQQPPTSSTYNAYIPVNYGPAGATQNVPIQISQQNMQYYTPQNIQVGAPPQQFLNQQYLPLQSAPIPTYGPYIPTNYGLAASQNIPNQTSQQNPQSSAAQNTQAAAPAPLPTQQATTQQQTPDQGNQGNQTQTQSNQQSVFTLSNITNAINLGVSAINLFETVDNAVNPGSYPGASSNSGGGANVTLNINAGGSGNQGSGQNSSSNNSGGSRLGDTTNLVNSLSSAVTALSSLNIGGNNSSSNNNGAASLGSNNNTTNFGFNTNLNSTGFDLNAFNNPGFNSAGDFGFGGNGDFGVHIHDGRNIHWCRCVSHYFTKCSRKKLEYFTSGTGSVRATLVRRDGEILASATEPITTYRDKQDHKIFEQSTEEIWKAIATTVRKCVAESKVEVSDVKGLGFDATCSLAVCDEDGKPVVITRGNELGKNGHRNVILWADHRAEKEAETINKSGSIVLNYVGGIMTTSSGTRSACSLACKCSYVPDPTTLPSNSPHLDPKSPASDSNPPVGWQPAFFKAIGLQSIVEENFRQLGGPAPYPSAGLQPGHSSTAHGVSLVEDHDRKPKLLTAGLPVGQGLTAKAAKELGLLEGTPVGSGVIDAYAGWIGTVGARYRSEGNNDNISEAPAQEEAQYRLAAVAGTSTCHLIQTPKGHFVPGVWGPYKAKLYSMNIMNAIFTGWWMNEGGQSSTGQLIDFIISTHPSRDVLEKLASERNVTNFEVLEQELERLQKEKGVDSLTELTRDLHFYPDLHGNRSPIADPNMTGSLSGLTLDDSISDLARKFNVALEAISLQTRHILDEMRIHGHDIRGIYMSGSQAKNTALMQLMSNTCNVPVIIPHSASATVVLGAAMLGRFAAEVSILKQKPNEQESRQQLWNIMVEMTKPARLIKPQATPKENRLLTAKYKIFRETIEIQKRWRRDIKNALEDV